MDMHVFCWRTSIPSRQDLCWSWVWLVRGAHSPFKMFEKDIGRCVSQSMDPLKLDTGSMERNRNQRETLEKEQISSQKFNNI